MVGTVVSLSHSDRWFPDRSIVATKRKISEVGGLRFTSPDRVVYPDVGVTKLELAEHYIRCAPYILPHIKARPVTLIRWQDNYEMCLFQEHIDEAAHDECVTKVWIQEDDDRALYASVDDVKRMIAIVQLRDVEFHSDGVRSDKLTHADHFIMYLDPD